MSTYPLSKEEFLSVSEACRWVAIRRCPPLFDLRTFVFERLKNRSPETAAKVKALDDTQIIVLCQELINHQAAESTGRFQRSSS